MNGTRMTDLELTAAYETYRDMVYRIALNQTENRQKAEDIQQQVFLALVGHSDQIQNEVHLKRWLIRVTVNACHKHFRSFWIKMTVLYDDSLMKKQEENGGFSMARGDDSGSAENDKFEILREAVEKLPKKSRTVVHLYYYEELPVKTIAWVLGISEQNVKTRLSRARDQLRQRVGKDKVPS